MEKAEKSDWPAAVELLCQWEAGREHLDDLLEHAGLDYSRWLVMETFRNWYLIEDLLASRIRRQPRPKVRQLLRLAVAECRDREPEAWPRVIHHAVKTANGMGLSKGEGGFINGVLRGLLRDGALGERFPVELTHPAWLVQRWEKHFGGDGMVGLLAWNQAKPVLHLHAGACPPYAEPTPWTGYFRIPPGTFAEAAADLAAGRIYIQDPFARIPVDLLDPRPGECILELCAAPGGKTRLILERMGGEGALLAVDKPGMRLQRLRTNLEPFAGESRLRVHGAYLEELESASPGEPWHPGGIDGVLIDVPCSNTGVIQKRPDVKLRIAPEDPAEQGRRQKRLLEHAARWVRPGGRLVYSTCSLEPEENEEVVNAFLAGNSDWQLKQATLSRPWECRHDGGGAFLLTYAKEH